MVTGRYNYALVGKLAHPENKDIYVNNPDLLSTDPKESALASVHYFLHRVGLGASQKKANRGISGHANNGVKGREAGFRHELNKLAPKPKPKPKPTK
jgi:predicted chitinase